MSVPSKGRASIYMVILYVVVLACIVLLTSLAITLRSTADVRPLYFASALLLVLSVWTLTFKGPEFDLLKITLFSGVAIGFLLTTMVHSLLSIKFGC